MNPKVGKNDGKSRDPRKLRGRLLGAAMDASAEVTEAVAAS